MNRTTAAIWTARAGVALLAGTATLHMMAYENVVSAAPTHMQTLIAASWVAVGVSLILAALLAVAATPLFIVRRRALLLIAALTPLSIAMLQIVYLGFIAPTALLLVDAVVLGASAVLGHKAPGDAR